MGFAALVISAGILLSRFMGLLRDKLISLLFGATLESDLYFAAFVIPDFINYLLAGGYFSITLIPFLTQCFEKDEEEGWRLFSTIVTWVIIVISLITLVAFIFAQPLARLAAPGLGEEALVRLAHFLRIILPAQIFFLGGSCVSALLFMRKQFTVPALAPVVYNLFIILGGLLLRERGMEGFCWGVLAGSVIGNFLLPVFTARSGGGLRFSFSFYHSDIKKYFLLALPLMIGQSITVIDEQYIRIFGSLAGVGAISWLNYARRIMLVPVSVVAQAASVASYPFLADLFVKRDLPRFYSTVRSALQNVLTLLIPASLWMMLAAEPIVRLIFQQGRFGPADTAQTAGLLRILLLCAGCWGYQQVLGRAFYSRLDTITPAIIGTGVTLLSIPVYYALTVSAGPVGVAAASAGSILAYGAVLTAWWIYKIGAEAFTGLFGTSLKVVALSLLSLLPAWAAALLNPFSPQGYPLFSAFFELILSGLAFTIFFAALAGYFIPAAARPFLERAGPLGRRLLRKNAV